MAFSGSQLTRLGLYGGPRGLYGSFAGKAAAIQDTTKAALRYLSLDIGGGLSLSLTPAGDLFQIAPITTTPIGEPQADKGVQFGITSSTAKIWVWNTSTNKWVELSLDIGSTVGSGTSGSILFVDSSGNLSQDNSNLFWDDTNNRIGIRTTTPLSAIDVAGSFGYKIQTVTEDTTLDDTYGSVLVDATAENIKITLPTATSSTRRLYDVKKIDSTSNTVTVDADGTEEIDGELTQVITLQWDSMSLKSDGSQWFIV